MPCNSSAFGRIFLLLLLFPFLGFSAQHTKIEDFIVKEHLLKNSKLAIIACDSSERPLEHFNGSYDFVLNGFQETLSFRQGVAVSQNTISKSTFLFIKHHNGSNSVGKLYYISKTEDGLNPIKINGLYVLLIPVILLLLGMFFRRFIWLIFIILIIYLYVNYQNGLDLRSFFESISHGIQDFISNL